MNNIIGRILCAGIIGAGMGSAATQIVCATLDTLPDGRSCTTTSFGTALAAAAASPDEGLVILRAGENWNLSNTTLPARLDSDGWITFESSRADEMIRGYRVNQADKDAGRLATLSFAGGTAMVTVPTRRNSITVDAATDVFTYTSAHGFAGGQRVAISAGRVSPLLCIDDNVPAYTGSPCSGKADYIYQRFGNEQPWSNDQPVYIYARTYPTTTTITITPGMLLYIRDHEVAGDRTFALSATPGGAAIDFTSVAQALYLVAPPYPLRQNESYFACDVTSTTFKLALTQPSSTTCASAAGGAIDITHVGLGIISAAKSERSQKYRFRGIEFKPQAGAFLFYLTLFGADALDLASIPRDFEMQHVYFHGNHNENGPLHGMGFDVINGVMRDSWCDEIKGNPDTQCILQVNTPGPTLFDNVSFAATGENYMVGGAHPNILGMITENVTFRRSYFPKMLYWWFGTVYSEGGMGADEFRMVSRYDGTVSGNGTPCNTVFTKNPSHQCFGYTKDGTRVVLAADQVFTGLTGTGTIAIGLGNDGTWIARHTSGVAIGTCAVGFTCIPEPGASIVWPADATRWFDVSVVSGAPARDHGDMLTHWITKNTLEMKYGKNYACLGCVHGPKWLDYVTPNNGGGQHQGPTLHPQVASVVSEPAAFWLQVGPTLWKNNVWFDLHTGVSMQQSTFLAGTDHLGVSRTRSEISISNAGLGHVFYNNLMVGNSNHQLGRYETSGETTSYAKQNAMFRMEGDDSVVDHNTVVDAGMWSVYMSTTGAERNHFRNNIFVPVWRAAVTTQFPVVNDAVGLGGSYCGIVADGMNPGGSWDHNILMNRHGANSANDDVGTCGDAGVDYPASTYMVTGAQNLMSTLFEAWSESSCGDDFVTLCVDRTSATDLRIAAASGYAAGTGTSTDGRAIGADIDEIEAETGLFGADVMLGIPPFRDRSERLLKPGSTTLAMSYKALTADACTINIWSNAQYSGAPTVETTDAAASVLSGRRVLRITGLSASTRYWGKRRCGAGVDVFAFGTRAAAPGVTLQVNGAPYSAVTAVIESGTSPGALSAGTPVSCAGPCTLAVPSGDTYYRAGFRDSGGSIIARGRISARP